MESIAVMTLGVRVQVRSEDHRLLRQARQILPPGATECAYDSGEPEFVIEPTTDGLFSLKNGRQVMAMNADAPIVIGVLDSQIKARLANDATDHVVIDAAAVAYAGRGILLPGPTFSGKSTLAAALVRAGATLVSDSLAIIDQDGLLHPFSSSADGATPVPIGMVATVPFEPGSQFTPVEKTQGEGAIALLSHTPSARSGAARVLPILTRATRDAKVLDGSRGEAAAAASTLLAALTV